MLIFMIEYTNEQSKHLFSPLFKWLNLNVEIWAILKNYHTVHVTLQYLHQGQTVHEDCIECTNGRGLCVWMQESSIKSVWFFGT